MGRALFVGAQSGGWVWAKPETHVMAIGPPRSGKTSCFLIPNVLAAEGPVLSTSTKPDVLEATFKQRSALGRCWLFDPFNEVDPPSGVIRLRWSPVTECADWTVAQLMCADLVNAAGVGKGAADPHWRARAQAILGTFMHAAAVGGADIDAVSAWVNRREIREAELILAGRGDPLAREVIAGLGKTDPRELSSVFSTAADAVAAYRTRPALESALRPNLAPTELVGSADTIYVCASSQVQQLVAPTVVMLVGRVCAAAYSRSRTGPAVTGPAVTGPAVTGPAVTGPAVTGPQSGASMMANRRPEPLLLALDEVANIAPIPGLPRMLSEGASQGVLVAACFQDLSQARARWGAEADGFGTLFSGRLVFAGVADRATLEEFAMLCGEVEVPVRTASRSVQWNGRRRTKARAGGSLTEAWTTRREQVLTPAALSLGVPGHALYFEGGERPGWVGLLRWDQALARAAIPPQGVMDVSRSSSQGRSLGRRDHGLER